MERPFRVLRALPAACCLAWVALYNGYPTVFSDTGSYLLTGATLIAYPPARAPGYSMFIRVTSFGVSAWLIVAMQALLVAYVLNKTCVYLFGDKRKFCDNYMLAVVGSAVILTSLPWEVSLLMPDIFAGVVFLSAFLLAYDGQLDLVERICLAAILIISISAHMSLLPIAVLYVVALLVAKLARGRANDRRAFIALSAWLIVPIIAAGLWTASLNYKMDLGFRLSPSRNLFLLARLFDDGLAADFLRDNCTKEQLVACRYLSSLPRSGEEFLFEHPLRHDLAAREDESGRIVRGTLSAYPARFVATSLKKTVLQLGAIRTGDEIRNYGARYWNAAAVRRVLPSEFPAFLDSRQSRGQLLPVANAAAIIHTAIFWLSLAGCAALAWASRFPRVNQFFYFALLFLIINAATCATLSRVYDRYQSRVAWLIPLCLAVQIGCLVKEWKRTPALSPSLSDS